MTQPTLQSVKHKLVSYGLVPQTRLARCCIILGFLLALWTLFGVHAFPTAYRIALLAFIVALLLLGYRAFVRFFMWRLRNRLIVTYIFIGVIPLVLLATMALVAAYLFAGQFSTFIVTSDVRKELVRLESSNRTLTHLAAGDLRHTGAIDLRHLSINNEAFPGRMLTAYYRGHAQALLTGADAHVPTRPPSRVPEAALVIDQGELYLRAVNRARLTEAEGDELILVSSVPLDKPHMESIIPNVGIINLYSESYSDQRSSALSTSYVKVGSTEVDLNPKITCGSMPSPVFRWDLDFAPFVTVLNAVHWKDGEPGSLLLKVRTRPSLLYNRLFNTLGDATNLSIVVLAIIAVIFAFIEVMAFVIGVRLTRTVTSSVAKLYEATQLVNAGDFSHRIQIRSSDQLASLEASFNSMTDSLQTLIAEQKEKQRIESELSIAKEVQDLLFPRDATDLDGLELHGVCRPARTVSGDYYDFLPVGPDAAGIAVGDISGKGIPAALMMATVHAFVRAHTLERLPALTSVQDSSSPVTLGGPVCCPSPGVILALLNQQLFRNTPAQKYATMILGFYNQHTRRLTYSNAGHLPPMVIRANGTAELLDIGGTVVGLFDNINYPEGEVILNTGDILVAYSDGITEPENEYGEFGTERLVQLVRENRDLPLPQISHAVFRAVTDWVGGEEQPDDMTIVLARAR